MILWHFLTKERLLEKLAFAKQNGGALLLYPPELSKDISKGELKSYIYCLPSLLSGMNFGDDSELHLLRIQVKQSCRVFEFSGNPRTLNYSSIAENYDVIDMIVDSSDFSNIRFRQILLINNAVIENWQDSLNSNFKNDFETEFNKLKIKPFPAQDFFMIDFKHDEIEAAIHINAHSIGFHALSGENKASFQMKLESALTRLGSIE